MYTKIKEIWINLKKDLENQTIEDVAKQHNIKIERIESKLRIEQRIQKRKEEEIFKKQQKQKYKEKRKEKIFKLKKKGLTLQEISEKINLSKTLISQIIGGCKEKGLLLSHNRIPIPTETKNANFWIGRTAKEIATQYNVSENTVYNWRSKDPSFLEIYNILKENGLQPENVTTKDGKNKMNILTIKDKKIIVKTRKASSITYKSGGHAFFFQEIKKCYADFYILQFPLNEKYHRFVFKNEDITTENIVISWPMFQKSKYKHFYENWDILN